MVLGKGYTPVKSQLKIYNRTKKENLLNVCSRPVYAYVPQ